MEPKKFRHFKGDEYTIFCTAHHSETNEDLVIYKRVDDDTYWARPKGMIFEKIEDDGKIVPRFKPIFAEQQLQKPYLLS